MPFWCRARIIKGNTLYLQLFGIWPWFSFANGVVHSGVHHTAFRNLSHDLLKSFVVLNVVIHISLDIFIQEALPVVIKLFTQSTINFTFQWGWIFKNPAIQYIPQYTAGNTIGSSVSYNSIQLDTLSYSASARENTVGCVSSIVRWNLPMFVDCVCFFPILGFLR